MAPITIPYGKTSLTAHLDGSLNVQLLAPAKVAGAADPAQAVREALAHVCGVTLPELIGGEVEASPSAITVAIAINDKTRPVAYDILLPPLLEELERLGIPRDAITFIIATGLHGPMQESEFELVLPRGILERYRVISHDSTAVADLADLGKTQMGTTVQNNRHFARAVLRIVVGNLEPHQFMGFSGGVKTAAIGLAGRETINANHSLMLDPRSDLARYENNPCRQDVEEIGRMIGVHFALNAVLNEAKQIVRVFAGEPQAVMQQGIPLVREIYEVRAEQPFDLMIVSPGGHPKDINLYQAQKALGHAARITRPAGTIILIAACPEGTGSRSYEEWVMGREVRSPKSEARSPNSEVQSPSASAKATADEKSKVQGTKSRGPRSQEEVIERFRKEGFRIGPHKAFQIARDSVGRQLLMVTDMPADFVRSLLLTPCASLDSALSIALKDLQPGARVGVMPFANATIPSLYSRA
ncbi:MAG: hypothetical protein C5B50_23175 [Verrucomicrobia bacterium]|nr:MAG: hypothetical protein C5B50_23175 [Verrucomicrobiota bacterium]